MRAAPRRSLSFYRGLPGPLAVSMLRDLNRGPTRLELEYERRAAERAKRADSEAHAGRTIVADESRLAAA